MRYRAYISRYKVCSSGYKSYLSRYRINSNSYRLNSGCYKIYSSRYKIRNSCYRNYSSRYGNDSNSYHFHISRCKHYLQRTSPIHTRIITGILQGSSIAYRCISYKNEIIRPSSTSAQKNIFTPLIIDFVIVIKFGIL